MKGQQEYSGEIFRIGIGTRFNDLNTTGWTMCDIPGKTGLIHMDIDSDEICRVYPTEVAVQSDAKLAIRALIAELGQKGFKGDKNSSWLKDIKRWKEEWAKEASGSSDIRYRHHALSMDIRG